MTGLQVDSSSKPVLVVILLRIFVLVVSKWCVVHKKVHFLSQAPRNVLLRTKKYILKLLVQIYVVVYLLVRFVLVRPILLRKIGLALRPYHIYSSFLSSSYVSKDSTYPSYEIIQKIWSRRDVIILLYYSFSGYILLIVIKIYYIYHIHSNIYIYIYIKHIHIHH